MDTERYQALTSVSSIVKQHFHPGRSQIQEAIRAELLQWCDPRPELSGIFAWEIAGKILDAIEKVRAEEVEA